jgi:methionyl-tRNA synthetase
VLGTRQQERTGTDPFTAGSGVTTVAVGGLDSAFGWIALQALVDDAVDFAPFDHIVVNRFMLLRGAKFSTSRKHVIRVNDALDHGLSPDVLRLMLARISPGHDEADLVPEKAAAQSADDCAVLLGALHRAQPGDIGNQPEPEPEPRVLEAAVSALRRQRSAFALPAVDLPAAAEALLGWAAFVGQGGAEGHPRFARQILALLAVPLMPDWAEVVWRTAAHGPLPGRKDRTDGEGAPAEPSALLPVAAADLDALAERGRTQ